MLIFSGVRVTRSLVLCVCFVDHCWSFCTFSFDHCVCLLFFDIQIMIIPLVSSNSSVHILHVVYCPVFMFLVPCCDLHYDILIKMMFGLSFSELICLWSSFINVIYIYCYCCPKRFPYQMMFVSFKCSMTGTIIGAGTAYPSGAPEFTFCFSRVQNLVFNHTHGKKI